jgi:cytosine/adenosine deaminase-related metal-dependent hydrolase
MKLRSFSACCAAALITSVHGAADNKIALVNGTLIDPGTSKVTPNALVLIEGDHITSVGQQSPEISPKGPRVIDCKGKFILPGYIDTHVHFFQSGDLYTRPDGVDLNSVRPYKDEVAMIKRNLPDTFARYLRSGITSVVDIGGPIWNFEMRKLANAEPKAPRVAAAGPLISSVSRPQLDLGDPPIVKIDTPEPGNGAQARRAKARLHQDLVHRSGGAASLVFSRSVTRRRSIRCRAGGDLPPGCSRRRRRKP